MTRPHQSSGLGRSLTLAAFVIASALAGSSNAPHAAAGASVIVSEVHSAGSGNGTYAADWFEVTNTGTSDVDIAGWKMDDDSNSFAASVGLRGVTTIPAGRSVVFLQGQNDGSTDATIIANFSNAWFGVTPPPAGVLIGAYGNIGLGTGGDAVNLFDAAGNRMTGVSFGAATANATFDNTLALPVIGVISAAGFNGAVLSSNGAEIGSPGTRAVPALASIDLSRYYRVGRFNLPERVSQPDGAELAREASAVTYNWDTDTLFITGDHGRAIVQVTKDGRLIDAMTLPSGGSSQGTEFLDPEGLTYIGNGQFVMTEERDRQVVRFTYAANTVLQRSDAQTVKLGTFVNNIGLEGLSYDPATSGFVVVKESSPLGLFQTTIDFESGTASNGSASTENSVNLFDPALAQLSDFGDIFALSNVLPPIHPEYERLLVLSQEAGRIVNIDRTGQISSTLAIRTDLDNPLSVADQQHEGLTLDRNGVLYVVSENGGGSINVPQLWVYVPAFFPNQAPSGLQLTQRTDAILENTPLPARRKVATVVIADDPLGNNTLAVTGSDSGAFEVDPSGLYLKANTNLDFETKSSYTVTVTVDDSSLGTTPDASAIFTLAIGDVVEGGPSVPLVITEAAPWASGNSPGAADWFEVTNTGTADVNISGWRVDDSSLAFANSAALNGITVIAPGESVIFIETSNLTAARAAFLNTWFGANPPAGLQIGSYSGNGIGLSTDGDGLGLFDSFGGLQARVSFGATTPSVFATFENRTRQNNIDISQLSVVGLRGAFSAVNDAKEIGSPGVKGRLLITEVAPWASGNNSPYSVDWFEVTNVGGGAVDISGWKVDDNSESPADAVALGEITSIAPGESVVFMETTAANFPGVRALFLSTWFGATPPPGLQVGRYSGSSVGLSTGSDAVVLYNPSGVVQAKVSFGASPGAPFRSFDNGVGLNLVPISQLSAVGVNGGFVAATDVNEIGSPGRVASLVISEVAPWSSGSAVGSDWFEVTNTGALAIDIAGWKVDDGSSSFAAAAVLTGVSTIAPGESAIFLETPTAATTKEAFLAHWFGSARPAGLQVGAYSGGDLGLSTGGDGVSLFDATGALRARVSFGASVANPSRSFDNGVGSNDVAVTTLSSVGVRGAFTAAADATRIASPGVVATLPTLTFSGFVFNRATRQFVQQVTLRNDGSEPLTGPIYLVLDALSSNATLANKTGVTGVRAPFGSSYVRAVATGATLAPGATATVVLQFSNPTLAAITYAPRVLVLAANVAP